MNSPVKSKRSPPHLTQVVRAYNLSPTVRRVVLTGDSLQHFPTDRNGAHIKVFLPQQGQQQPVLPSLGDKGVVWPPAQVRPITRTYSVRKFCPQTCELQVDFVLHGDSSPASGWASSAKPGDFIGIAGPGGPDPLLKPAAHHVLVGDLTAVPAIAALLEQMPAHSSALVLLWAPAEKQRVALEHPRGVDLHWLFSPQIECSATVQSALQRLLPKSWKHNLSAFVAGENAMVLHARDYLCEEFSLDKRSMYATPYWRYGQNEEAYHQERHRIMDQVY